MAERAIARAEPTRRVRATQQRTVETRRKIIEAAISQFAAEGYDGTSTRTVAEKALVPHTLVTYHFNGKEGLWREAIATILGTHTQQFEQRLEGLRGVDPVIKLRIVQEEFIRFSATNLDFHQIMGHIARKPGQQLDWLVDEYLQRSFGLYAELIRTAQAEGKYVEGNPYHLQYLFIGAVTRIFLLSSEVEKIMGRSPRSKEFVDEHVKICLGLFFR